jgi:hypothetical protein
MHVGGKLRKFNQLLGRGLATNVKFINRLKIIQSDLRQVFAQFTQPLNIFSYKSSGE